MTDFHFFKMHGCGNDFVIIDAFSKEVPSLSAKEVSIICNRHFGVGADGLLILKRGKGSHASWMFFNSDGSEAEMCGNALRCVVLFLSDKYFPEENLISIETKRGILKGKKISPNTVEVGLFPIGKGLDSISTNEVTFKNDKELYRVININTGVPHAVIEVDDSIENYPISKIGKFIQKHAYYKPEETNVTFFERALGNRIRSTTYERGVESQTFACGTGVAASAIVFSELYLQSFPIEVQVPGGEFLVDLAPHSKMLTIQGEAEYVMEGNLTLREGLEVKTRLYGIQK